MFKRRRRVNGQNEGASALSLTLQVAPTSPGIVYPAGAVDALRHMVSRLMRTAQLPARVAMVAALPEEGVTYATLALATTLAHDLPAHVCVVELNWWRPGMAAQLAGLGSGGMAAALCQGAALEQVIVTTALPNLTLLPAGQLPIEHRPAVARSDELKRLIAELSRQFDCLLLDVPALTLTSDAIPLASLADACCVVVRQGVTPGGVVKRALQDIDHLPMLGVVLNRAHVVTPRVIRQLLSAD